MVGVVIRGLVLGLDGWFDLCIFVFMCTTKHYKMKIFSVKYFTTKQMEHKTQLLSILSTYLTILKKKKII